jgi:hypothetical protein
MVRQIKVAFDPLVIDFLEQLTLELYEKDYFGFYDSACEYVDKIIDDISSNIHIKPSKKAPSYFSKYGKNLVYISYQPNKTTIWYIFFNVNDNRYLIRYITNNHVSGHLLK